MAVQDESRNESSSVNRAAADADCEVLTVLPLSSQLASFISSRCTRTTGAFGRGGAIAKRQGVYRRAAAQFDDEEGTDDEDGIREDITKSKNLLTKPGQDARKYY